VDWRYDVRLLSAPLSSVFSVPPLTPKPPTSTWFSSTPPRGGETGVVPLFFFFQVARDCSTRVAFLSIWGSVCFSPENEVGKETPGCVITRSREPFQPRSHTDRILCQEQGSELPGSLFAPDPSYMLLLRACSLASYLSSAIACPTEIPSGFFGKLKKKILFFLLGGTAGQKICQGENRRQVMLVSSSLGSPFD
jgi:hypothetical protein